MAAAQDEERLIHCGPVSGPVQVETGVPCVCQGVVDFPREPPSWLGWFGQIMLKHVHFQGVLGNIGERKVAEEPSVLCGLKKSHSVDLRSEGVWLHRGGVSKIRKVCQSYGQGWKGIWDVDEGKWGRWLRCQKRGITLSW